MLNTFFPWESRILAHDKQGNYVTNPQKKSYTLSLQWASIEDNILHVLLQNLLGELNLSCVILMEEDILEDRTWFPLDFCYELFLCLFCFASFHYNQSQPYVWPSAESS